MHVSPFRAPFPALRIDRIGGSTCGGICGPGGWIGRWIRRWIGGLALAFGLAGTLGCEIVDAGPEVGVPSPCSVSPAFFVERIVPEYLEANDCADAGEGGCHDADTGSSIYRLEDVSDTLTPTSLDPVSAWPQAWQVNLENTVRELSCASAPLSPLYTEPAGGSTASHGGGELFPPNGPELELIEEWLASGG